MWTARPCGRRPSLNLKIRSQFEVLGGTTRFKARAEGVQGGDSLWTS